MSNGVLLHKRFLAGQPAYSIAEPVQCKTEQAKLYLNNDTASYITNDKGEVSFLAKPTDQFRIVHKDYDSVTLLVSQVPSSHVIEVKKPFSWKDLLTPMFYIINGGLWFLLFVVFAETGLFVGFFCPETVYVRSWYLQCRDNQKHFSFCG